MATHHSALGPQPSIPSMTLPFRVVQAPPPRGPFDASAQSRDSPGGSNEALPSVGHAGSGPKSLAASDRESQDLVGSWKPAWMVEMKKPNSTEESAIGCLRRYLDSYPEGVGQLSLLRGRLSSKATADSASEGDVSHIATVKISLEPVSIPTKERDYASHESRKTPGGFQYTVEADKETLLGIGRELLRDGWTKGEGQELGYGDV
ncbi:hypothetical protein DB88DRAFT_482280 [Papiliotrema laurentii]|uniref:Uncharacterized protein n=1 Tax=Papiliotrema laurentii TaxID=5418 RepID=A0AAD9FUQ5_PAPLA|nr:hypothetical protein DB88DRAFT_482280 [Papiliotrema laurentii]